MRSSNAHIQFYHNVQNLARTWYFTQAAATDPRARTFPYPDSLMGRLLEYVLAHEVGHTIGFQHNMKASSQYPLDSIRNPDFLRRMGHVATLMDYSRFNYVVQPEDHVPAELLIPRIGPYDIWATHWGYAPIAAPMPVAQQGTNSHTGAELIRAAEAKRTVLDQWAREQDSKPWLRFSTSGAFGSDPGDETEAVGDVDPVRATELGFKNLQAQHAVDRVGDGEADRRLRRARRAVQPRDRPVPHGARTRRESRRRHELAGEVRRPAGRAVRARAQGATASRR